MKNKQAEEERVEYVIIDGSFSCVLIIVQDKKNFITATERTRELAKKKDYIGWKNDIAVK